MNIFITGGAGFIGCNVADYFLSLGHKVTIFDNLSRPRTDENLEWLNSRHDFDFQYGDVRSLKKIEADLVLHFAGQVAVTTSVKNPREDFEINALGSFNVLEAVRKYCPNAGVFFSSTNKVYGNFEDLEIVEKDTRYIYSDRAGIDEKYPLNFCTPYGVSKGSADQYFLDYAKTYGLKTVVFRQSCIYGQRQFGVEDQGWLAHFFIAIKNNLPLKIFGDGKQVRDILNVFDLARAYDLARKNLDKTSGMVYNIGGGVNNSISIWNEFSSLIKERYSIVKQVEYLDWRPGDQKVYISDISKAKRDFGWQPEINVYHGLDRLYNWINKEG